MEAELVIIEGRIKFYQPPSYRKYAFAQILTDPSFFSG